MVRNTLRPTIQGVEGMRREGARHNPLVMGLVEGLVNQRVVQAAVNPVDAEIGEGDKKRKLEDAIVRERLFVDGVVQLGVSPNLGDQEGSGQKRHDRHRSHGLRNLHGDLIFEELWMLDCRLVPDEDVGEGCGNKVNDNAEDPILKENRVISKPAFGQDGVKDDFAYQTIRKKLRNWR